MSDQQQTDPWATVREEWIEDAGGGRMMQYATDVEEARAEVERRHAEALDALKATHEAAMAAAGRSHAQALEKVKADRDALLYRVGELATERDELRAQFQGIEEEVVLLRRVLGERNTEVELLRAQLAAVQSDYKRGFFDGFSAAQVWGVDAVQEAYSDYAGEPLTLKEPK